MATSATRAAVFHRRSTTMAPTAILSPLRRTLTQKPVLYLCVHSVQPLFRTLDLLLIGRSLCFYFCNPILGRAQLL
jgi:hypothetical protein